MGISPFTCSSPCMGREMVQEVVERCGSKTKRLECGDISGCTHVLKDISGCTRVQKERIFGMDVNIYYMK